MLALIHDNTIAGQFPSGGWATLPNGDRISPAHDGWSQDGYALAEIQAPTVPDGKRVASAVELIDGAPTYAIEDIPTPTTEDYQAAIVAMLDAKAQERRYDNATSISTYVGSTIPGWAAEATAYMAWRDAVWDYAYEQLDLVTAGERPQPTVEDFLAELPEMVWPE